MNKRAFPSVPRQVKTLLDVEFPTYACPTLEGVRVLVKGGLPLRQSMQPLRNQAMNTMLTGLPFFDGCLSAGPFLEPKTRTRTQYHTQQEHTVPEFVYWATDVLLKTEMPFKRRLELVVSWANSSPGYVRPAPWMLVRDVTEFLYHEDHWLEAGAGGVMLRSPEGLHIGGRVPANSDNYLELVRPHHVTATLRNETQYQKAGRLSAEAGGKRRA